MALELITSDVNLSRHKILLKELFPFTFVVIMWLVHVIQGFLQENWADASLYPRTLSGLAGVLTAPFLHADFSHLAGNTLPMLFLGYLLFNAYREIAGQVFWLIYLITGVLVWLFARDAFHLGSSGVIYGMAAFLFVSGIIRKIPRLMVLSLLIVFLYGTMVWGIFPFDPHVSWESHLYGALTGIVLSVVYRKQGPQPLKYFEDEKEEDIHELTAEEKLLLPEERYHEFSHDKQTQQHSRQEPVIRVLYDYKEKDREE
ncbi:MAG: rhomboid family intramembrane serine protease [Bacteroidia bacterium]